MNEQHHLITCVTTAGTFDIQLRKDWAPLGSQRVHDLVQRGWFDGVTFNRVSRNFLVQFGIRPPGISSSSTQQLPLPPPLLDDPPRPDIPFEDGIVSFAGSGTNTRQAQIFITYGTQRNLGKSVWETPVGFVSSSDMKNVVHQFYGGYGDMPPWGQGPSAQRMQQADGQQYLDQYFPMLTKIKTCTVVASSSSIINTQKNEEKNIKLLRVPLRGSKKDTIMEHEFENLNRHYLLIVLVLAVVVILCGARRLVYHCFTTSKTNSKMNNQRHQN